MICSMVLAPHTKKPPSPYEFFAMPILSKHRKKDKKNKQDLNYAAMFNDGYLNPLKKNNITLYNKLKDKGLINEDVVNKYIIDKWQGK